MEIFGSLVALLVIVYLLRVLKATKKSIPPGPIALPIVGHLHLLRKPEPLHQTLWELSKKHGPLMMLKLGSIQTLVVSSADAARQVLKTHELAVCSRPQSPFAVTFTSLIVAPYGEYWKGLRRMCTTELLTVRRIKLFQQERETQMQSFMYKLLEASKNNEVVNMSDAIRDFAYSLISKMTMGKSYSTDDKEASTFCALVREVFEISKQVNIGDCFPWLKWMDRGMKTMNDLAKRTNKYLKDQIEEHKATHDRDNIRDFIDVMISHGNDTVTLLFDMIVGGFETTAQAAEWALAEIVQNPQVMKNVQEELDMVVSKGASIVSEAEVSKLLYLQAAVKESFRLHPPATIFPRESSAEFELEEGYVIPKKTQVFVNAFAMGRDASVWENPLEFRPERMLEHSVDLGQCFEMLTFGYGRRSCPGMNFGLTVVHFSLANLLYKFEWHGDIDMTEAQGFTLLANPIKLTPVMRMC